ncbi:MAG TPA: hypothetical protein VM370_10425 [Candidatus Thermoplasmatota archaeon]|nr:hypothetical protein [Candidatus Thermoplasmatota archaeon]
MRIFLALPDAGLPPEVDAALRGVAGARHGLLPDVPPARAGLQASERERFLQSVDRMMDAEMLVADVSAPDAGVGWCLAWFLARGRLAVLTCRRDARAQLAAMVAGNPSPWQRLVLYDDAASLTRALESALSS